jgi:sugar diacid utilization regulator
MGAAKDEMTCASIVFNQVASVGKMAMTVTLGESDAVTSAASATAKASRLAQLKDTYNKMKTAYETAKKEFPALQNAEKSFQTTAQGASKDNKFAMALNDASEAVTAEDLLRAAAQIASSVDSSGVSSTIEAYTYPKCSEYFGNR